MSDQDENAGSETSTEQTADTTSQETESTGSETASAETTSGVSTDTSAQVDEGTTEQAAEATSSETSTEVAEDPSRTGFAEKGLRAGDECVCPDGRNGTVHQYDAGLICMPNQDQG
jgi:hypothetical protein